MFTGIYQSIVILAVLVTFYLLDTFFITSNDQRRSAEGSGRSWSYTASILLFMTVVITQPLALPQIGFQSDSTWALALQWIGLVVVIIALGLHVWSRVHLRHFYAERVELQPRHQLIDSGPYAYIRHPVFTSFFLITAGLFLINPSLLMVLLCVYVAWDFSRAARAEEVLLSENLPGYAEYVQRTGRFLPTWKQLFRGNQ